MDGGGRWVGAVFNKSTAKPALTLFLVGRIHLFAPHWLNYSWTDFMTDLPMVCKFKFVRYGHIKKKIRALRVSVQLWRPLKVRSIRFSNSKIVRLIKFWLKILNWFGPRVKSFEARGLISWNLTLHLCLEGMVYWNPPKSVHNSDFWRTGGFAPPHQD